MSQVSKYWLAAIGTGIAGHARLKVIDYDYVLGFITTNKADIGAIELCIRICAPGLGHLGRTCLAANKIVRWKIQVRKTFG